MREKKNNSLVVACKQNAVEITVATKPISLCDGLLWRFIISVLFLSPHPPSTPPTHTGLQIQ